jgi:thiopeptide-type bacteriocin biosynthesis protein
MSLSKQLSVLSPAEEKTARAFAASGFFVLRTPLLPFEEFLALSEGLTFPQALRNGGLAAAAVDTDRKLVRARLLRLLERPEVQEALWLASPEFVSSLLLWKEQPEGVKGQRLERAAYRYAARMTSRATPFGLFAGCALGTVADETRLEIGHRSECGRRSRLDLEYLCNLAEKISSDPILQPQLRFRPNTSLYLAAGRYHHAQSYLSNEVRCYRLIATEPSPYLQATLERAAEGATPSVLAAALTNDDPMISTAEAEQYLRLLIASQMLVPDLMPPITGPEPIEDMLAQLQNVQETLLSTTLRSVVKRLRTLDEQGLGNAKTEYEQIVKDLRQLPAEFKVDHLMQVDMMQKAAHVTLDHRLLDDILHAVEVLRSLDLSAHRDPFQEFKENFRDRYQDQEIPLTLALDEEVGIGFERKESPAAAPEPLIEDIDFSGVEEEASMKARRPEFVLFRKIEELAKARETRLELDGKLLKALRAKAPLPLPDAFACLVQLIGPADAPDKCLLYLQGASGPSGAILLGRFCPADDQLTLLVRDHLRQEEACQAGKNVVYAEIAHLPEGRIGNVICRPMLRRYEIPFIATSRAAAGDQIPVTDLMVSVQYGRIILRSQRLGCEVVPRLTTAHSYTQGRNLKLYKFLCLLQTQGISGGLSWDWGILDEAAFLPRVTLGKIIFAPARWRLGQETIEQLAEEQGLQRLQRIDEWRRSQGLPRFVLLAEADNQLLIDFENVLSVETLIEYIKKRQSVRLVEMLASPENLYASSPEGRFTHELVVPFVRKQPQPAQDGKPDMVKKTEAVAQPGVGSGNRDFMPGSEWLFAKIYGSPSQVDRLLLEHVRPLASKVLASGAVRSWFFIRYGDPHWHIRLRFHGDPESLTTGVLPMLSSWLELQQQQGTIWRVQLDTYQRELERYGGLAGMRISERLFQYDSELVLDLLASICKQLGGNARWHLAFASVDQLLDKLDIDLSIRRQLVNRMGEDQETRFRTGPTYKKQLSEKFRKERSTLDRLLANDPAANPLPAEAQSALARFAKQVGEVRAELEKAKQAGELTKTIEELAGSYVHMHLNRLFRAVPNAQEAVLYDFLGRSYDSKMVREKQPVK